LIEKPIFLLGMPRSGTTLLFHVLAARPDLAWFSQHLERAPRFPAVSVVSRLADLTPAARRAIGRSDQHRPWLEKLRVGPSEAYTVWERCCGRRFRYDFLLGTSATADERRRARSTVGRVLRYQGKPRFAAKITGPARVEYLTSIFPDARFVHVIRDGRAVAQSLMRVHFWRDSWRMHEPAWTGGLSDADLAEWERFERSPLALAAIQWRVVVRSAREEAAGLAPDRYAEIRYEDFVASPHRLLDELAATCDLGPSPKSSAFLDSRIALRDMNFQWRERFSDHEIAALDAIMGETLAEHGYGADSAQPGGDPSIRRPFVPA